MHRKKTLRQKVARILNRQVRTLGKRGALTLINRYNVDSNTRDHEICFLYAPHVRDFQLLKWGKVFMPLFISLI
jgi:hypothetical protein